MQNKLSFNKRKYQILRYLKTKVKKKNNKIKKALKNQNCYKLQEVQLGLLQLKFWERLILTLNLQLLHSEKIINFRPTLTLPSVAMNL